MNEKLNNRYPMAFVSTVWDTGYVAMTKWLKDNAPAEVQELHEALAVLTVNMQGEDAPQDCSGLEGAIKEVAQGVESLGGRWYGPNGSTA